HLYVVRFDTEQLGMDRAAIFAALRARNIGVNVHYVPVHLHPYYRERLGTGPGLCPVAEAAYERIVTLPMFSAMTGEDVLDVVAPSGVSPDEDGLHHPGSDGEHAPLGEGLEA